MESQVDRYTTHSMEVSICRKVKWPLSLIPTANSAVHPRTLVVVTTDGDTRYGIRCFHPVERRHRKQLIRVFLRRFPFVEQCCAYRVADRVMNMVQSANASHHCLGGAFTAVHMVDVHMQPLSPAPLTKPATLVAIIDLFDTKESMAFANRFERGAPHECAICTEEIETRESALEMPCFHVFHHHCLLRWLDTTHVCPLCRYALPAED